MPTPPNHPKKILILSATAGAGHARAAEGLLETSQVLSLPVFARHVDILDYTFPIFKKVYGKIQFAITDASPELWGYLYKKTEFKGALKHTSALTKLFDHFNYKEYFKLLETVRPDAMVCTHFLPYSVIAEELRKSSWHVPIFSVTTDYELHSMWSNTSVERFYVASEQAAWTVRSHGSPPARLVVTGIPVLPPLPSVRA